MSEAKPLSAYENAVDRLRSDLRDDAEMFHLAPVSLWLEDFSGVRSLFEEWRQQGVTDLRRHLREVPARVQDCFNRISVIKVNRATLKLFEAESIEHLMRELPHVFDEEKLQDHVEELVQLWEGAHEFSSQTVNYTLGGRRLDVQLRGSILPGYEEDWGRILLAVEDISEQEKARRGLAESDAYARGLFQHSPVSLWVEDFSAIKTLLDEVRARGINDFRVFIDVHPEFVRRCMSEIRVLEVNRHTLELFGAPDAASLLSRLDEVFRGDMEWHFKEQLIDLWDGKLFQLREVVNYTLDGNQLHLHLQLSVLPGHEDDWALVQVALTDITARKKAESYLEYLGKHDVLTKLYNRSFYVDELSRLERRGPFPVTIVIADLNGLKDVNDRLGHAAGDALLRRVGEVLNKAVEDPRHAARIGGDEFALVLPATDEHKGALIMETIRNLVELNNHFYSAVPINLSIGAATSLPDERLEEVAKRADSEMYEAKRQYYSTLEGERRRREAPAETTSARSAAGSN